MKLKNNLRIAVIAVGILLVAVSVVLMLTDMYRKKTAESERRDVIVRLREAMPAEHDGVFDGDANPNAAMPTLVIDKKGYIGLIYVPELGVELPVCAEFQEMMPMRLSGNAVAGSLAVGGELGDIKSATVGHEIVFYDVKGNVWHYTVTDIFRNESGQFLPDETKLTFHFSDDGADITVVCS